MKSQYPKISVSIPDERVIALAKAKAKQQRRSVSNYIAGLIEADLAAALKEAPPSSTAVPNVAVKIRDSVVYRIPKKKPVT